MQALVLAAATVASLLAVPLLAEPPAGTPLPAAEELLARAIAHHDPAGLWPRGDFHLTFEESRPEAEPRHTRVEIDNVRGRFTFSRREEGVLLAATIDGDGRCSAQLDGTETTDPQVLATHHLGCDEIARRRDYYTYLWGLPMKLRDPGTRVDPRVDRATFDGRVLFALRVTYDAAVGSDTWIFYFDPASSALAGYRFYHDETAGDGEYIRLDGETAVGSLRLPRARAWYTHQGDLYLGTDVLVEGTVGTP